MKGLFAVSTVLLTSFGASQVAADLNRVVVTVNGEEVRAPEYYRRMEYLDNVGRQMGQLFANFPPGLLTIDQIVTEKLLLDLAKKNGVTPNDVEITRELDYRTRQNKDLLQAWIAGGRTIDELRYNIKLDIAQFKLVTNGITVTDAEVTNHYNTQKARYSTPKSFALRVITVSTNLAKVEVDNDLKAGKPFADVAKARSTDLTKASGGDYGVYPESSLAPVMKEAISTLKAGETTGWLEAGGIYAKFLVERINPEIVRPLDDDLRRVIRNDLMLVRGRVKNDLQKMMNEARKAASIDIKQPEFAEAYKKFIETYLNQKPGGK